MPSAEYLPKTDGDRLTWFNNLSTKLPNYAALLAVSPAEVSATQADCAAAIYMINQVAAAKQDIERRVQYKETLIDGRIGQPTQTYPGAYNPPAEPDEQVAPGIVARTRALVKRIKANANYTPSIGDDLDVLPVAPVVNPNSKPTLTGIALTGMRVEIKFVKNGFDAVKVESRRGSEGTYTYLGTFVRSPFVDSRAPLVAGQSEQRSYRATYLRGNDEFGLSSESLVITTVP